jgi:hypothetical protein
MLNTNSPALAEGSRVDARWLPRHHWRVARCRLARLASEARKFRGRRR